MRNGKTYFALFVMGLLSKTQFHFMGSIGISEFIAFLIAPFIIVTDYQYLRRDGFLPVIWLGIVTCVFALISGKINNSETFLIFKGLALPYGILAGIIVYHKLLRNNLEGVPYAVIGAFLSGIISIYIFQPESATFKNGEFLQGEYAVEAVTGYALFLSSLVSQILFLPINTIFLKIPHWYSWLVPVLTGLYTIFNSGASGRSAMAMTLIGAAVMFFGGKSKKDIAKIGKNFVVSFLLLISVAVVVKFSYSCMAKSGMLGYESKEKYERQTQRGSSILSLLMSGRVEFFTALRASVDKPLFGHGYQPIDEKGYMMDYLSKYGDELDYQRLVRAYYGYGKKEMYFAPRIPAHSHIAGFWLWFGLPGLLFWSYVIYLIIMYFKKYASAVPQWFGLLGLGLPFVIWNIFFSPIADRVGEGLTISLLLFVRAVYNKQIGLPQCMTMEILKHER